MLVIHNFGVSATKITLTDKIEKAVGVNGDIQQKKDGDDIVVKMGAYSTVVFKISQ